MTNALIVVDPQVDFCEGGALPVWGGAELVFRINQYLTDHARDYSLVVVTRDWHISPGSHWNATDPDFINTWPVHCEANTPGARFHQNLRRKDLINVVIDKGQYSAGYSGFDGWVGGDRDKSLLYYLNKFEISDVDICGIAYDYCVKKTAINAADFGYSTRILTDLTLPVDQDEEALKKLEYFLTVFKKIELALSHE